MFEKIDKTLFLARKITKTFCILAGILCVIVGIILCATCSQEVGSGWNSETVVNISQLIGGIVLIVVAPFAFWIAWIFNQVLFNACLDLKIIRNKLYGLTINDFEEVLEASENN